MILRPAAAPADIRQRADGAVGYSPDGVVVRVWAFRRRAGRWVATNGVMTSRGITPVPGSDAVDVTEVISMPESRRPTLAQRLAALPQASPIATQQTPMIDNGRCP